MPGGQHGLPVCIYIFVYVLEIYVNVNICEYIDNDNTDIYNPK